VNAVQAIAEGGDFGDLPTLWIHGTDDQLVPYDVTKAVVEKIGGSKLEHVAYEGAAHEVFNETNRDEVIGDVTAFLQRVLAR
jgi:alpha-beta hydrolase superfamily lysophospholipase